MTAIATLVADPPWRFRDRLPGPKRGAASHYPTLSVAEIQRFPLPELAPDCRLFLWRPEALQAEALAVISAWGFRQVSSLVWVKLPNRRRMFVPSSEAGEPARCHECDAPITSVEVFAPDLRVRIGMGRQTRLAHETCLIAVRGRPKRLSASVPSVLFAPRGRHSEKPRVFYERVEQLSPGPHAELFARRERAGWDTYGDELERPAPGKNGGAAAAALAPGGAE